MKKVDQDDEILKRMQGILIESDQTVARTKVQERSTKNSAEFWSSRRKLNSNLEALLDDLEKQWFGSFAKLLIPMGPLSTEENEKIETFVKKLMKLGFSHSVSTVRAFLPFKDTFLGAHKTDQLCG